MSGKRNLTGSTRAAGPLRALRNLDLGPDPLLRNVTSSVGYGRSIAAIVAALVLLAQLIAAAHVHPDLLLKGISDRGQAAPSEVACPICAFHVHTPTSTAAAFLLVALFLTERFVATARRSRLLCASKPQLFGRAPPAA